MASQLITVVLLTALFSEALALMCYKCLKPSKECTINCTSSSHCTSSITYSDSSIVDVSGDCADDCADVNYSINLGPLRKTAQCCSSDLCISKTDSYNEKRCHMCIGLDCSQKMSCKGDETQCITVIGDSNIFKGCASKSICTNTNLTRVLSPFILFNKTDISCCEGNLCNSGQSLIQGAVLLVPVLSFILFN